MPTFPQWEETVLFHCYEKVDYISLHQYQQNKTDDLATYLAASVGMDRFIDTVVATCDFAQAKKRSKKKMFLSFDEWNIWFHTLESDKKQEPWIVGPHLLEDVYTFEDALVVGCLLNSLLRHADRVKIACLAQLVNVIAPIMTEDGGSAWKQTIYWPFYYASRYGRGTALDVRLDCGFYENAEYCEVPWLDASAVLSPDGNGISVFVVNRSSDTALPVDFRLAGFDNFRIVERIELSGYDKKIVNTAANPDAVAPKNVKFDANSTELALPPLSWTMVRLSR